MSRCVLLQALSALDFECFSPLSCSSVSSHFRECRFPSQAISPSVISSLSPSFSPSSGLSRSPSVLFSPSTIPSIVKEPTSQIENKNKNADREEEKNNTAAVVGAIACGFLALALCYLCFRRRQKHRPIRPDSFSYDPVSMHSMGSFQTLHHLDEPMLASFDSTTDSMTSIR